MAQSTPIEDFPTEALKGWFRAHKREMPWRASPTPYRIWVSEVMLQQTQVSVVIPYFERWMEAFPTLEALSQAPLERVLKLWEGLGYYSRARNLHKAAQMVVQNHGGELPQEADALARVPGIGLYTQGAIRSFAFHQKAAAVDGNVVRVLARFFALKEIATPQNVTPLAQSLLPEEEPWVVSEALIELGATLCTKGKPVCGSCPLKAGCLAYRHQLQEELPKRAARPKTLHLKRLVGVIEHEGTFLVQQVEKGRVMADLFEFPYLDYQSRDLAVHFEEALDMRLTYRHPLPEEAHSFTRYRVKLFPHLFYAEQKDLRYMWEKKTTLFERPFSSGHRRILEKLSL